MILRNNCARSGTNLRSVNLMHFTRTQLQVILVRDLDTARQKTHALPHAQNQQVGLDLTLKRMLAGMLTDILKLAATAA